MINSNTVPYATLWFDGTAIRWTTSDNMTNSNSEPVDDNESTVDARERIAEYLTSLGYEVKYMN